MENASKALAIAGGILLALLVLWTLVHMVQNAGELKRQEVSEERQKQILEFNKEYESFDKKLMRGTDVITALNMANNYNSKNAWDFNKNGGKGDWDDSLKIKATVKLGKNEININKEDLSKMINDEIKRIYDNAHLELPDEKKDYTMAANTEYKAEEAAYIAVILDENNALKEFKRKFFKCTGIGYSNTTGLVNKISFKEIEVGDIPGY